MKGGEGVQFQELVGGMNPSRAGGAVSTQPLTTPHPLTPPALAALLVTKLHDFPFTPCYSPPVCPAPLRSVRTHYATTLHANPCPQHTIRPDHSLQTFLSLMNLPRHSRYTEQLRLLPAFHAS